MGYVLSNWIVAKMQQSNGYPVVDYRTSSWDKNDVKRLQSLNLISRSLSLSLSLSLSWTHICHPPISGRPCGPGSWGFALNFLRN